MKKAGILIILFMCSVKGQAQIDSVLLDFSGIVGEKTIQLNWKMKGGYQCAGTIIQRSSDSIHFTNIGDIPGICGSLEKDEYYSFTDNKPLLNQVSYYRIVLGALGESRILKQTYYEFSDQPVLVFPVPSTDVVNIVNSDRNHAEWSIEIFEGSGKSIYNRKQRDQLVRISKNELGTGFFIYVLTIDDVRYSGRIIIH